jgi:hypothetical protein
VLVEERSPIALDFCEGRIIAVVEDYNDSICFVQTTGKCIPISLLTCHVPELQSDSWLFQEETHEILTDIDIFDAELIFPY